MNETFARSYFPGEPMVGQTLSAFGTTVTVVGVVEDVRHAGLDAEPRPEIYMSPKQSRNFTTHRGFLVVRAAADPIALVPELRGIVQSIDPDIPLINVMTMEARVSTSIAQPRFYAWLVG